MEVKAGIVPGTFVLKAAGGGESPRRAAPPPPLSATALSATMETAATRGGGGGVAGRLGVVEFKDDGLVSGAATTAALAASSRAMTTTAGGHRPLSPAKGDGLATPTTATGVCSADGVFPGFEDGHPTDGRILVFRGFYREGITETLYCETTRLRHVVLQCFLKDVTVQMYDPELPSTKNDGMPHGLLLKRIAVEGITAATVHEALRVGNEVEVFGKHIVLYACDEATRKYSEARGEPQMDNFEPDLDAWTERRAKVTKPWNAWFGVKTSSSTRFIEAVKGLPRQDSKARYLEYDGVRFRFLLLHEYQDGTKTERFKFWLTYHMASQEAEIHEEKGQRAYSSFLTLLRRGRLPKSLHLWNDDRARTCDKFEYEHDYYNHTELLVGTTIAVYGRKMLVCDCDDKTQKWYLDNFGYDQKAHAVDPDAEEKAARGRAAAMSPDKPKRRLFRESPERFPPTKFDAKLDTTDVIDATREFIVLFHHDTHEVTVFENELRNSGIRGGLFLRRSKQINVITGEPFTLQDLLGASVEEAAKSTLSPATAAATATAAAATSTPHLVTINAHRFWVQPRLEDDRFVRDVASTLRMPSSRVATAAAGAGASAM